ncbi:MAG: F0F1 ATP synthase subunit delta [Legionellaceae bacterium]|nr:F0F1 ATP synthase subunit delta [Legionellaceae bacterium]
MSDNSTVARPYAKAIFEFAIENKQLAKWSETLEILALITEDPATKEFISNPSTTHMQRSELVFSVLEKLSPSVDTSFSSNLLKLLAENGRLQIIPDICLQYCFLRAEYEKTLAVEVVTFSPLTASQEETLVEKLTKRLQRSVSLKVIVDESLKGGAVIRAGHLVFDASVVTQIKKLSSTLAA